MFKLRTAVTFLFVCGAMAIHFAQTQETTSGVRPQMTAEYGKLPLSFEANQGQTDKQVRFTSRGNGYSLFLADKEAVLALSKGSRTDGSVLTQPMTPPLKPRGLNGAPGHNSVKTDVVRMQLAGAAPGLKVSGEDRLPGTANYFIGNDPAKWHSSVPTYAKVKYSGVYPGVDLVYYGNQQQLEYDFVVAPGADPKRVKLHFAGAEKLKLNSDGDLMVVAKNGEISFHKPVVYQQFGGERRLIRGQFARLGNREVGFVLGGYDHSASLVIDPTLAYSTYLGGSANDGSSTAFGVAVDSSGSAYVTGYTYDPSFPVTTGAYRTPNTNALNQPFVSKLNPTGTELVYSTYFGGSGDSESDSFDSASSIAVDSSGNAYITGEAASKDFPVTSGAFQTKNKAYAGGLGEPYVAKLNASGTALIYCTYLGGSGNQGGSDGAIGIALDSSGHAYVVGAAWSGKDFPITSGAYQTTNNAFANGSSNAFISEINTTGSALIYSTFLGGNGGSSNDPDNVYGDSANAVTVDKSGNAYVTGYAGSADFPTAGTVYQNKNRAAAVNGPNVFVSKLNSSGSALPYSTYLGGTVGDIGEGIAVDSADNVYVTGYTLSTNFPVTSGAFQTSNKSTKYPGFSENGFIGKLDPTTGALVYSTYLGGSTYDGANSIAVDASGNAYVTGTAASADFPVTLATAYQAKLGGSGNAFVTELNTNGAALVYSTFLGGKKADGGVGIALDSSNSIYVTGNASSPNFPTTPGAYLITSSNGNPFVAKFSQTGTESPTDTTLESSPNPSLVNQAVTFTATVSATGGPTPTGTVTFYHGGTAIGTGTLNGGVATLVYSGLTVGSHSITAIYGGSATDAASTSPAITQVVDLALISTTTKLASTPNPSVSGQSVTFTATVTPASGSAATGTVTFYHGGTSIGTATLAGGVARVSYSGLTVGDHSMTAVYAGSATDATSTSPAITQVVNQ